MGNNKKGTYDNESIKALKNEERVRLRPSVIFGSDGLEGCQQSIFEIISNSIDEAREGYGDKIEIIRHADNSVTVNDWGRGVPVDYNANEKKYNWELVFCELYAGGKYDNNEGGHFKFSLGLNGLGLCSTQYASEYMDVEIVRDGSLFSLHFEKGKNIGGLKKTETDKKQTGTSITWKPDLDVFTDIDVPIEYYQETLKRQAIVNKGLKFHLVDEETNEEYEYYYEKGILDYIEEINEKSPVNEPVYLSHTTKGRDRKDKPEYELKFELAFCFTNDESNIEYYHNSSYLEYGGSPDKAVKSAFSWAINKYIRESGMYKKNEKRITYQDVEDCLVLILSSFSTVTSYENQTKKAINNNFIQEAITDFLKENLEIYFVENKDNADKIAKLVLVNKRSRETAERTRQNVRKKLTGTLDMNNKVAKFVNCRTRDVSKRELYIVEGDSALGSCKMGRDSEFQAIMPIRGKILNCLKADYNRIFASDIIIDLLRVLGCGVEIKTKHNKTLNSFELDKLRWDKVILCTDADVDGFQIRTLLLTMLYRLVPTLIDEGKVFIAESPLYEITTSRKTYFAYDEMEKNKILKNIKTKYKIQRSKGLGENEPEMMWQTTMNPETRQLIRVMPGDVEASSVMFDILLGNNLEGRKDFIEEFGHKYIDLTEVV